MSEMLSRYRGLGLLSHVHILPIRYDGGPDSLRNYLRHLLDCKKAEGLECLCWSSKNNAHRSSRTKFGRIFHIEDSADIFVV